MNESFVTVCGNLVGDPQGRTTKSGKPFASFRIASTSRRWDSEQRAFVDGSTNFVNVVGFNALGANIMASLGKGDPVVVYGRLRVNQYIGSDGKNMTSVEVDAHGVGHDLTRGQSVFTRPERVQFDARDRLADPHIQATLVDEEPADLAEADREPGDLEDAAGGDREGTRGGGAVLTEEDADTDAYVVASV